ncbi:MAG: prenyltransferase [Chloroflexi bacterium]|nr:prenyltransferase [Chloroflexota bacterium]
MSTGFRDLIHNSTDYIARHQLPSGAIPWLEGDITDPWDHVECAIALDLAEKHDEARKAYEWLLNMQNPDGSWYSTYLDIKPQELARDTNYSSYVAVGLWCYYLTTGDKGFLEYMWPTLEGGLTFALSLQQPTGEIWWSLDPQNRPWNRALTASCSCICLSLGCGIKIARILGKKKPEWEAARRKLASALLYHPERFDNPGHRECDYAMAWFYPVLSGIITGPRAKQHLLSRWDDFIVENWGCKCIVEEPWWVTSGETCELIMALARLGEHERARQLLDWIVRLQDEPGTFWSGMKIPEETVWPEEKKFTWVSAGMAIAATTQLTNGNRLVSNFWERFDE